MKNVHIRTIDAPAETVGALFDQLAQDPDPLWPSPAWLPIRFDGPLAIGADGGHGDVRYWVSDYEPGRRIRCTFHSATGIDGYHEFTVDPLGPHQCVVRCTFDGQPRGWMRVLVPLVVRSLHDALLEDLLDNAERAATGRVNRPATWSPWVRLWRHYTETPKPHKAETPEQALLARSAFDQVDFTDAWQIPLLPGMPTDPQTWADTIFRGPPRAVGALLVLRNGLVRLVGIEPADRSAFDTTARTDDEVLLGTDAGHLDFRASILVDKETVTLTTVTRIHNRRGKLYMAGVSLFHPVIVRRMLRGAFRRLALESWSKRRSGSGSTRGSNAVASRSTTAARSADSQ